MKRRDFLTVSTGLIAARLAADSFAGLGEQFLKGPLRVESSFDVFDSWTGQVVSKMGGWSTVVNRRLWEIPIDHFESFLNQRDDVDFAFINTAMWEHSQMFATLFSWVPFGHSVSQHQAWLASGGQEMMDRYFAQFGLKAITFGATGGISGLWTKQGVNNLASLRGGEVYGRPLVRNLFQRYGMKGWENSLLQKATEKNEGFRIASGLDSAKQSIHKGELTALDWMSPYRDLQKGIPQTGVGYVKFEPDPSLQPAVFFIGVTSLSKWESLKQRGEEIHSLANQVVSNSSSLWSRYDQAAINKIKNSGIKIAQFKEWDVMRLKECSREILAAHAHTNLERRILDSYLKYV